jgi:ubiquinone/menaquinone biosynthesis C-methylase UbiE
VITDTNVFCCPRDRSSLSWPGGHCKACDRTYLYDVIDTDLVLGGNLAIYDFRPDERYVVQDRLDVPAYLKIVEGLTYFERREFPGLGFSLDATSLQANDAKNSSALLRRLWHGGAAAANLTAYVRHILFGGYSHKVDTVGDSVQSSFEGYARAFEMLSDLARPVGRLVRNGRFVVDRVIKHHYDNMLELARVMHKWGAKSALEVGCGTGVNLILLSRCIRWESPIALSGFDYSVARFLSAVANLSVQNVTVRDLFLGDARALPLERNSFDVVFSHYVIEQIAGFEESVVDNMVQVARKGVVLFETAKHPRLRWNQRVFLKHSGYSRRLIQVIRRRRDLEDVTITNNTKSYLYGCPNVMFVLRKRSESRGRSGPGAACGTVMGRE